jgi:chemotaxis protein MotB
MSGRKKNSDEGMAPNVGLSMTVSLFLIILTFFILLCSLAVMDDAKTRIAIGSLIGSFGSLPRGLSPLNTGKSIMPLSAPVVKEESRIDRFMSEIDRETLSKVKIERLAEKQIITLDDDLLFEQDSHRLKPNSSLLLGRLGRFIEDGEYPVEIIGHTDNTSAHVKGYRSNWELSALAALAVLKHLVKESRTAPSRVIAYGAGSEKPILSNATGASRRKNNRIEIVLHDSAAKSLKRRYEGEPAGLFIYKKFDFRVF